MKRLSILTVIIVATLIISACGGEPAAPTMNAVDVQNTAVALH
jgi:PBP1b-binding outer membrane lipoprotein LpoB